MKEMICISCPLGCHMTVDASDINNIVVTGNTCPRGKVYAINEMTAPKRMVTGSVKVNSDHIAMVSVKTSQPIDKHLIFDSLACLNDITLQPPVEIGDVVVANVLGTGVDYVATKKVAK